MDKSEIPFSIFIDLSKAFDTLDHNILINKLQYYGIKDTALDLFQSYLSNRRQYVKIGNNKSDTTAIRGRSHKVGPTAKVGPARLALSTTVRVIFHYWC